MTAAAPPTSPASLRPLLLPRLLCVLALSPGASPAAARPDPLATGSLQSEIVSASRRETTLLATPGAISVFSDASLRQFAIAGSRELMLRTPSLNIAARSEKISIRGLGRPGNTLTSDPGVALYRDGAYSDDSRQLDYSGLFDVERVEVLRGPQGILQGPNAVAGAINIISMAPSPVWKSRVNLELGNYDYQALQGIIRGPITDQFSMVAAGSTISRSGFQRALGSGEDFDDRGTRYLRLGFRYHWHNRWYSQLQFRDVDLDRRPANGYRLLPFATDYVTTVREVASGRALNLPGMYPGQNIANAHQGYTRANAAVSDPAKTQADVIPRETRRVQSASFLNEVALGDFRLKYLAAFEDYDYSRLLDQDGSDARDSDFRWSELELAGVPLSTLTGIDLAAPMLSGQDEGRGRTLSHDLQFYSQLSGPINFVSGLYYLRSEREQFQALRENNDDVMAVYRYLGQLSGRTTSSANWLYRGRSELLRKYFAAYGEADWTLSSRWRLSAGLRYSLDEKEGDDQTFYQWVADGALARSAQDEWDHLDWRLGLDYSPTEGQLFYAELATGYRSGGFNLMKATASPIVERLAPEELLSLELGYKGTLLAGRLQVATAAYYYDLEDKQLLLEDIVDGAKVYTAGNAETARAWGLEAEARALLGQHLSLGGALSWNESRYGDYASVDTTACALGPLAEGRSGDPLCTLPRKLSGKGFALSPEYKINLWTTARWQWAWASMEATLSYSRVGEQSLSPFDNRQYDRLASRERWDSQLGASYGDWRLALFVNNITDTRDWLYRQRPSSINHSHGPDGELAEPRTWGLRLSHHL